VYLCCRVDVKSQDGGFAAICHRSWQHSSIGLRGEPNNWFLHHDLGEALPDGFNLRQAAVAASRGRGPRYAAANDGRSHFGIAWVREVLTWVLLLCPRFWKSLNFFSRFSMPGKSLKTDFVLESPWICVWKVLAFDFIKCRDWTSDWIQWQLLIHLVNFFDYYSSWLMLGGIKFSNVNLICLIYMFIKVPVWFN